MSASEDQNQKPEKKEYVKDSSFKDKEPGRQQKKASEIMPIEQQQENFQISDFTVFEVNIFFDDFYWLIPRNIGNFNITRKRPTRKINSKPTSLISRSTIAQEIFDAYHYHPKCLKPTVNPKDN